MPLKDSFSGNIAIVAEREIALGFRLIGIEDSFIGTGEEGVRKFEELYRSGKYSLIMLSENLQRFMDRRMLNMVNMSTRPLVVFIPLPGGKEEESVAELAKRVLGVEIGR
ncbi:ATP synthase subunit F [Thermogymnomonas acidicola]|uniref:ATP synthase subunit F n=1 Tax=Thermogymnomonas acidicola TaxID=399579 RepID=A0AA37F8K5_9ARCH|nr:V-type ATP synthase subunit F [Thermogymnomonas acidicola]GGM66407.1 ATP synthase subunit F [Thermogymnomonas acidicola]